MEFEKIRLISTDFDGTLVGHPSDGSCCPEFRSVLEAFKADGGIWVVNTGRALDHIVEGLNLFRAGLEPDYLITHERDIFQPGGDGEWHELSGWNAEGRRKHEELFNTHSGIFDLISECLLGIDGVNLLYENGMAAGLISRDEATMVLVDRALSAVRSEYPDFSAQRNTIYLRFCHVDYDKGSALRELCGRLEIDRSEVFAVGDHFNDLPMLDGSSAAYVACPANAIPEVKSMVLQNSGLVATLPFGAGTAECLETLTARRMSAGRL